MSEKALIQVDLFVLIFTCVDHDLVRRIRGMIGSEDIMEGKSLYYN